MATILFISASSLDVSHFIASASLFSQNGKVREHIIDNIFICIFHSLISYIYIYIVLSDLQLLFSHKKDTARQCGVNKITLMFTPNCLAASFLRDNKTKSCVSLLPGV